MADIRDTIQDLNRQRKDLLDVRRKLDDRNLQVAEYVCPDRGKFPGDENQPDQGYGGRGNLIIDSTAQDCFEIAMNGIHSGLTPPSREWWRAAFEDPGLNEYGPAKNYLEAAANKLKSILRRSNFYSSIHNSYGEILAFGVSCVFMEKDVRSGLRFRPFTWGEYCISCDASGRVDTVFRDIWMTARQIVALWGEKNLTADVKLANESNSQRAFQICHAVRPRKDLDPTRKDAKGKAWESIYWEANNTTAVLSEGGFSKFPFAVARWLTVGNNVYSNSSPAQKKIPDIKMLQDMEESGLIGIHRSADPPIVAPTAMQGSPIRNGAGQITFSDDPQDKLRKLYDFQFDIQAEEVKAAEIRHRIGRGLYNDLFLMINALEGQKGGVTATQIAEMQSEKLLQLGPFIEREEDEGLDPHIQYGMDEILENPWKYQLPPPPKEIQGQVYKVEYISLLAMAQRAVAAATIDDHLAFVGNAAQIYPSVLDTVDIDEAVRARADMKGVPARIVRGQDAVLEVRKAKQEKMAQQEQMQAVLAASQGTKNLAQSPMNPEQPNVLSELMKGAEQVMQ